MLGTCFDLGLGTKVYPQAKKKAVQRALPVLHKHLARAHSVPRPSSTGQVESANAKWMAPAGKRDNYTGIT